MRRIALALFLGLAFGGIAALGEPVLPRATPRARCWQNMRMIRLAISAFEEDFGRPPGQPADFPRGRPPRPEEIAALLAWQLAGPIDRTGRPVQSAGGATPPYATRYLPRIPENPFTGSRRIVVVPPGEDALAFAARSTAGWAYLAEPGFDARGWLPAGVVIPCGRDPDDPARSPQEIAFELEDRIRWR